MSIVDTCLNNKTFFERSDGHHGLVGHSELFDLTEKRPSFVRDEKEWVPLEKVGDLSSDRRLRLAVGSQGLIDFEFLTQRMSGYIPILSFYSAFDEFRAGWNLIFEKGIKNENMFVWAENKFQDSKGNLFWNLVRYKAHLTLTQRVALVAIGVALIFRAFINFLQIGIIFLPFDLFFDFCIRGNGAWHRTEFKRLSDDKSIRFTKDFNWSQKVV